MKQYVYKPSDIGLDKWQSGDFSLPGVEEVHPDLADVFVCPEPLYKFKPEDLAKFPYIKDAACAHVFFDAGEELHKYEQNCIYIRCAMPQNIETPRSIAWPWMVENYVECVRPPSDGFLYDVSFQGWISSPERIGAVESCKKSALKLDFATYRDFTGYIYDKPEGIRRRREFRRSMKESRVALCPTSIPGVIPYRFYEAMSAGRIPVLVGKEYVLPFNTGKADDIPYHMFCLFAGDPSHAGLVIKNFLSTHSDEELISIGSIARHYWELCLDRDKWPKLFPYVVARDLDIPWEFPL